MRTAYTSRLVGHYTFESSRSIPEMNILPLTLRLDPLPRGCSIVVIANTSEQRVPNRSSLQSITRGEVYYRTQALHTTDREKGHKTHAHRVYILCSTSNVPSNDTYVCCILCPLRIESLHVTWT